jgi:hypothetical protein
LKVGRLLVVAGGTCLLGRLAWGFVAPPPAPKIEKVGLLFASCDAALASISFRSLVKVMVALGLAAFKSFIALFLFAVFIASSALRK